MAVWHDFAPGHEAEFEAWYRSQHIPERLRVPGFREARRYEAIAGSPRYCAFYWLDAAAVLGSPAYRERLAQPTAWTQRMMPHFRAMARTPACVSFARGAGIGGTMSFIAAMMPEGSTHVPPAPRAALEAACAPCCDDAAVVQLQLWECDPALAARFNPEAGLRAGVDAVAAWILVVETANAAAARAHTDALAERLRALAPALMRAPVYRLLWALQAADAPAPCADPATLSRSD